MILFLNKKDILKEKLEHSHLKDYFPEYEGIILHWRSYEKEILKNDVGICSNLAIKQIFYVYEFLKLQYQIIKMFWIRFELFFSLKFI